MEFPTLSVFGFENGNFQFFITYNSVSRSLTSYFNKFIVFVAYKLPHMTYNIFSVIKIKQKSRKSLQLALHCRLLSQYWEKVVLWR